MHFETQTEEELVAFVNSHPHSRKNSIVLEVLTERNRQLNKQIVKGLETLITALEDRFGNLQVEEDTNTPISSQKK